MRLSTTRIIELIVAVSVVVISVVSLFVAVEQSRVQRQMLQASVLPVIQYGTGNYNLPAEEWRLTLNFTNTGIGPAELQILDVRWNDASIGDFAEFIMACCVPQRIPENERQAYLLDVYRSGELQFIFDSVQGRFFAPGESVDYISARRPDPETQPRGFEIWSNLDRVRHELDAEICYCSVFEDCWLARFPAQTREPALCREAG